MKRARTRSTTAPRTPGKDWWHSDVKTGTATTISKELDSVVVYHVVYHVVGRGKYEGDLVVLTKQYFPDGISQFYWLFDPEGKKIGYVGETQADAQAFLKDPNRQLRTPR